MSFKLNIHLICGAEADLDVDPSLGVVAAVDEGDDDAALALVVAAPVCTLLL